MNKEDFLNSDFVNTKWDARSWTPEMKLRWQAKAFELGAFWSGGFTDWIDDSFYYVYENGEISHNSSEWHFKNDQNIRRFYVEAFTPSELIKQQEQKIDSDKPSYDLLPMIAINEMAKVITLDAEKNMPNNWRHVDNAVERCRTDLLSHSFAMIMRGEEKDSVTGLPHAAHIMCCAAFLVELEA